MCAVTPASSAKSMSLIVVLQILVFALSLAMLYSLPSDFVCMSLLRSRSHRHV